MSIKRIQDKEFRISIPSEKIQERVDALARQLNRDLKGEEIVFIAILNGAFMFASDIVKQIELDCRISFLKLASYEGTTSNGAVRELIGLNEDLKNKTVVILEDIVDTGHTLDTVLKLLDDCKPKAIKVVSLLHKPEVFAYKYKLDYIGFEIPNDFIVGYGLDYNGFGRNLNSIYTVLAD